MKTAKQRAMRQARAIARSKTAAGRRRAILALFKRWREMLR